MNPLALTRSSVFLLMLLLLAPLVSATAIPFSSQLNIDLNFGGAFFVHSADLDGDGDADVVGAGTGTGVGVSWWKNNLGNGTSWTEAPIDTTFDGAYSVHAADIDGDGDNDVVGAAILAHDVVWWENALGDGSTWTRHDIDVDYRAATSVDAKDVDGDGDLDVLATARTDDEITWFENVLGDGLVWTPHLIDTFDAASSVHGADVDGDGDVDVIGTGEFKDEVAWWRNVNGDGLNWTQQTLGFFNGAISVYAGDIDGDGDTDIVGAAVEDDDVTWWENLDGLGNSWSAHVIEAEFNGAHSVVLKDMDCDGDLDVLGAARVEDSVAWFENLAGDGSAWQFHFVSSAFDNARSVYADDVDGDGDLDVLGAASNASDIAWWRNETLHRSARFPLETLTDGDFLGAVAVRAADLDGDGDNDILGTAADEDVVMWWDNVAGDASSWVGHAVSSPFDGAIMAEAADVDGDGDLDVVGAGEIADQIRWWENDAGDASSWTEHILDGFYNGATDVVIVDLDGDGDNDVVGFANVPHDANWWENVNGDGSVWTKRTINADYDNGTDIDVADVDGDGDMDVLGAADLAHEITWFENVNGDALTWSRRVVGTGFQGASGVDGADVDGDGDVDLLGTADASDFVTWWENLDGTGLSWTRHDVSFFNQAEDVYAVDLDKDGDLDVLAAAFKDGGKIHWWENLAGTGLSWTEHIVTGAFDGGTTVFAADLDGDGDLEILGGAKRDHDLSWWNNLGGQFALTTTSVAPVNLGNSVTAALLRIVVTHRGKAGEAAIELATLELLFEQSAGIPLNTTQADNVIQRLQIFRDDPLGPNPGSWNAADFLIVEVSAFNLTAGVETVVLPDGNANATVTQSTPGTFFAVIETTPTYTAQNLPTFRVTHVTEGSSTAEDSRNDIPLSLEHAADVSTPLIVVNPSTPTANLSLTKTASPEPVDAGAQLTYTLTVTNGGPSAADDVVVTDELPGDVTLVSSSGCAEDPAGAPTCSLGTINPGGFKVYTLVVTVDAEATGPITNTATVSSSTVEANPGDETDSAITTVNSLPSADLSLAMTDSVDPVGAGNELTYTLSVTNNGPDAAEDVEVTVDLDPDVAFLGTSGCDNDPTGEPTCELGTVPASSTVQYTLTVTVDAGASGTLSSSATVTSTTGEANAGDESANEETTVTPQNDPVADVAIVTRAHPGAHTNGEPLAYSLTVTNAGPADAFGNVVADTFPAAFVGASWTCTAAGGATCNPSGNGNVNQSVDLPAGSSVVFYVTGTATAGPGDPPISNTATVTIDPELTDPSLGNNSSTVVTHWSMFTDGFESGDVSRWSGSLGF